MTSSLEETTFNDVTVARNDDIATSMGLDCDPTSSLLMTSSWRHPLMTSLWRHYKVSVTSYPLMTGFNQQKRPDAAIDFMVTRTTAVFRFRRYPLPGILDQWMVIKWLHYDVITMCSWRHIHRRRNSIKRRVEMPILWSLEEPLCFENEENFYRTQFLRYRSEIWYTCLE